VAYIQLVRDFSVPPNEVFVFFVPQRMPLWYGTEMNAHFEVQGGAPDFAVGQKAKITGDLGRWSVTLTAVVTAYEWERLLEWQFLDSYGVRGLQRWELQPVAGGSRLNMRDSYRMPGLTGRLIDAVFTRFAVSKRDKSWLDRLQHLAERR
jgi:uncharacterized protein YndB with AHSA1/START domain